LTTGSDFATKQEKPTAQEYLEMPLEEVIERLNNNPCGLKSEEEFIHAVILVRAAKINERLTRRLNWLTGIMAVATVLLVIVPFFVPTFEKVQLEKKLNIQNSRIDTQS
jgi:hypothetical protein